jgi:hypothetical protein
MKLSPFASLGSCPRALGGDDLVNLMFAMTCYIVLQFFKIRRKIAGKGDLSLVIAMVSLSPGGLGQAWDELGQIWFIWCREDNASQSGNIF